MRSMFPAAIPGEPKGVLAMAIALAALSVPTASSAQGADKNIFEKPVESKSDPRVGKAIRTDEPYMVQGESYKFRDGDEVRFSMRRVNQKDLDLNIELGPVAASPALPDWHSAIWIVENQGQYARLRNKWTGCYLHMQYGRIECGEVVDDWWSAQWHFIVNDASSIWIGNRWKSCFLNVADGKLRCTKPRTSDDFIHWHWNDRVAVSAEQAIANINAEPCPVAVRSTDGDFPDTLCLKIRDYPSLPEDWNDDIEIVENFFRNISVQLFEHANFQGRSVTLRCFRTELIDEPENEVSSIRFHYSETDNRECTPVGARAKVRYWDF